MKSIIFSILSLSIFIYACSSDSSKETADSQSTSDSLLISRAVKGSLANKNHGFLSIDGEWLLKEAYSKVGDLSEGLVFVESDQWSGYVNLAGDRVIETNYSGEQFAEGLARISETKEQELFGYMDKEGKVAIPVKYQAAHTIFSEGLAGVMLDGKFGFIDKSGKQVIPHKYTSANPFSNHVAVVGLTDQNDHIKWGIIDNTGKEIIPLKYDQIGSVIGQSFSSRIGTDWGLVNLSGAVVIPHQFENISLGPKNTYELLPFNGAKKYVDSDGKAASFEGEPAPNFKNKVIDTFSDGKAIVQNSTGKKGYINPSYQEVIPYQFDEAYKFVAGYAYVRDKDQWNTVKVIDSAGKLVKTVKLPNNSTFSYLEGIPTFFVKGDNPDEDRYGLLNNKGDILVQAKYQSIRSFAEGMAAVQLNGFWGFIDQSGKEVIKPQFKTVADFKYGRSIVEQVDEEQLSLVTPYTLIDKQGTVVSKDNYFSIQEFERVKKE